MHESSEDFEIGPDLPTDCGVSCPLIIVTFDMIIKSR